MMWGRTPPGFADSTIIQVREGRDVSVPREGSTRTFSSHLLYPQGCSSDHSLLTHPQHSTALVPSQKRLCQTLSRALDHRNYLHREALFGSAVVTEQINGWKRSEKKLWLWQLHPCEQPLAHVWCWEEKCAGKRERCSQRSRGIQGDVAVGVGLCILGLCILGLCMWSCTLELQPAEFWGVHPRSSCI